MQNLCHILLYYFIVKAMRKKFFRKKSWYITSFIHKLFEVATEYSLVTNNMELWYEQEQHIRKSLVICATHLTGGLLLKKLKYFEVMLNILEFSRVWENVEFWLVYENELFWIAQSNEVSTSFFFLLLRLLIKKRYCLKVLLF